MVMSWKMAELKLLNNWSQPTKIIIELANTITINYFRILVLSQMLGRQAVPKGNGWLNLGDFGILLVFYMTIVAGT